MPKLATIPTSVCLPWQPDTRSCQTGADDLPNPSYTTPRDTIAGSVNAQQSTNEFFREKLAEISKSCEDQGRILAEARINKWKKAGQNVEERLGENAFSIISKILHQQCVSIQHVALLRMMKSFISTEEASRMNIDGEISRQMEIIERTL